MSKFLKFIVHFCSYMYDRMCPWTGAAAILWSTNSDYGFDR